PQVFICDECVAVCLRALASAPTAKPAAPEAAPPERPEAVRAADAIRIRHAMGLIDTPTAKAQLCDLYDVPDVPDETLHVARRATVQEQGPPPPKEDPCCSFCDKAKSDVATMIAGPRSLHICDECIALCEDIIGDDAREPA